VNSQERLAKSPGALPMRTRGAVIETASYMAHIMHLELEIELHRQRSPGFSAVKTRPTAHSTAGWNSPPQSRTPATPPRRQSRPMDQRQGPNQRPEIAAAPSPPDTGVARAVFAERSESETRSGPKHDGSLAKERTPASPSIDPASPRGGGGTGRRQVPKRWTYSGHTSARTRRAYCSA
jgi:hypothetical protein